MKRSFEWVLVFAAITAFLVEGCGSGAPKDTRAEDEATIRAYSATASEAARTKDVDKVTSFYADDALAFSNYSATTTTKEAMQADLRNAFSAPGTLSWKTSTIEVARSGDLAYEHGRYTYATTEKDGKNKAQEQETTCWCGESSPAAIGRSRSIHPDTAEDPPLAPPTPLPPSTK